MHVHQAWGQIHVHCTLYLNLIAFTCKYFFQILVFAFVYEDLKLIVFVFVCTMQTFHIQCIKIHLRNICTYMYIQCKLLL